MENPKTFISYSWSNPQHEQWVIYLAAELRQAGVDVVLDKWGLREGHDAIAFIEKMVTEDSSDIWWPDTSPYLSRFYGPFEILARAESKRYFEKMKCLLDIKSPDDFEQLLGEYQRGKRRLPGGQIYSLSPALLLNIEKLGTTS